MNLDKLKEAARRHELREEWRKAIEVYQRALADLTQAGEPSDPSLYNRIGDLELKAGEPGDALRAYEQAADSYADQGFFNNAIALCGKILRVNSGRTATYLRLAELHARKNVIAESKRNLLEYVDRMTAAGQMSPMLVALRSFAARFAASAELRGMLGEILATAGRRHHGREEFEQLAGELGLGDDDEAKGPGGSAEAAASGGLVFIDTGIDAPMAPVPIPQGRAPSAGPDLPPIARETGGQPPAELGGFEPTLLTPEELAVDLDGPLVMPEARTIPGLEALPVFEISSDDDLAIEPISLDDDMDQPRSPPTWSNSPARMTSAPDLLFDGLDVGEETGDGLAAEDSAGIVGLEDALARAVAEEHWTEALEHLAELIRREPNAIPRYQERVEVAYRSGDRIQLLGAYLSLGEVLERAGARENAVLVYRRVLDHDAGNPVALRAIAGLESKSPAGPESPSSPPAANGGGASEFIDLGALILDPEPARDTRMRVDQSEPESEADVDFRETLEQFRQGIEANIDATDFQAHYDLGIAFKEMGLLDEAIAQFQKALRAPEHRLRSTEALGASFFEKGRYAIAEAVLARALEALPGADEDKIALIYWLGRAFEAQGRSDDALRCYERALAVDITFLDLGERIHRLTAERAP